MSTQQSSQADELDLTDIFTLIKRAFYNFLALCFKALDFILKFWWVLVALIFLGVALGYFTKKEPKYEGDVVVQINYETQPYVYQAIQQINIKLSNKDESLLEELGVSEENLNVSKIEITPIIDLPKLIRYLDVNERALTEVFKKANTDDEEVALLSSEMFYSHYDFHRITFTLKGDDNPGLMQGILNIINNHPDAKTFGEKVARHSEERIEMEEHTIDQMDAFIESYNSNMNANRANKIELPFLINQNSVDLSEFFTTKASIIRALESAKNGAIRYSGTVVAITGFQAGEVTTFKDSLFYYPFILIFLFLLVSFVRFMYVSLKKEVQNNRT